MQDILDQIGQAVSTGLYYVGLFTALALPDICAALEAPDGLANKPRFIAWFDRYVAPKYSSGGISTLTGETAYYFRCSMLHQGRMQHRSSTYSRILFVEPSGVVFHNNVLNDALNIDVRVFTLDVVAGAEEWLGNTSKDPNVQRNLSLFVQRYPAGLPPYIGGIPVIS